MFRLVRRVHRVVGQMTRYIRDEDDKWQDVLAQEQVGQLGFYFRLRIDSEIDWVRYRNLKYLKDYLDKSYSVSEPVFW